MSADLDNPWKGPMKAFLLNEALSDIHFLVGIDDFKERIPAHKIILSMASEMFHGQLNGHYEVPETITVDDPTPASFKRVLSYIYTHEVGLTPDNASAVLYLARKYLLKNLVTKASTYIITAYNGESVAKVLPHLQLLDEEHAGRVWDAIDVNANAVLKSPTPRLGCQRAHRLQQRGGLDTSGVRNGIEEFASGPVDSNLLSDQASFTHGPSLSNSIPLQEVRELCKWYGLRTGDVLTTFSSAPRKPPMLSCVRFDLSSIERGCWWFNSYEVERFFDFSVNARVRFHGVAFFGREDRSTTYEVDVSLLEASSDETLATTHATVTTDPGEDTYAVLFEQPVMIAPSTEYKITAVSSICPYSTYPENGRREITCEHGSRSVTFTFPDTGLRGNDQYHASLEGHVPVVYFSFA